MAELIKLTDVSLAFPGKSWLLKKIDLSVQQGEFVGILGATGSGKSTLLHIMCGVIPHFIRHGQLEGKVELLGQNTSELTLAKIASQIGVVGQDPENQLFNLLVKDEVAWALENRGVNPSLIDDRVNAVLDFMQISHLKERVTYDLSGGEKQRLVLAATYISQPDILFLDTPTSQLDPLGAEMFIESIREILSRGQTVVMIEDKIDTLVEYADRIVILDQGTISVDCSVSELDMHVELLKAARIRPPHLTEFRKKLKDELGIEVPLSDDGSISVSAFQSALGPHLVNTSDSNNRKNGHELGCTDFVQVKGIGHTFLYPRPFDALTDVDFSLNEGSLTAIIGQNGSGKTTLARCISGYLDPTQGLTIIDGHDVHKLSIRNRAEYVGYVFQNPDHQIFLDPVVRDVEFGPRNLRWSDEKVVQRTEAVLKMLGLWEKRDVHPYRLSKGDRQRLAIAAIAVMEPKVLIIDEPTTGQDPYQAEAVMDLLRHLRDEFGMTVVVITHEMSLVASYCDRTVVLLQGQIVLDGPTRDVLAQPDILRRTRVQPPPITRLALSIGWSPPPLTVDDAIHNLGHISSAETRLDGKI